MENNLRGTNLTSQSIKRRPDRRIAKTKKAICNAFVELLATKDLNNITIKDIADLADVNRKTVYNYYSGIHEILDEIENKIVLTYIDVMSGVDFKASLQDPTNIFNKLTDVLSSNLDFYGSLLKINANSQLVLKIMTSLKEMIKKSFLEQNLCDESIVDFVVTFIVSGLVASYQHWFNSGRQMPIEDFSKEVSHLILFGVKGYLNKDF